MVLIVFDKSKYAILIIIKIEIINFVTESVKTFVFQGIGTNL